MARICVALVGLFVIAPAQWSEPVNVTRIVPGEGTAYIPSLAIDSTGTLHASWSLRLPNEFDWIDYATKPAGSDTWLAPVHVSRDSYPYRGSSVVIGPGGVPHVLWQTEGQNGHLYVSHKSGDTWSIPERCPGWNRWGFGLRACADRQHRIHAVWGDLDLHTIWYARYNDSGWQEPEAAVTATGEVAYPDVATDRAGYAHVVYQPPGTPVACGYVRQTDGGWLSPELIPGLTGYGGRPRIALDTGDYPQVAWHEGRKTVYSGWTGAGWSQSARLDSGEGFRPAICSDSFGRVHIAFSDAPSGLREIVGWRGVVLEGQPVDTSLGTGELVCELSRVHAFLRRDAPEWNLSYSWRELPPPGVGSGTVQTRRSTLSVVASPGGRLSFFLSEATVIQLLLYDAVGRRQSEATYSSMGPGHCTVDMGAMVKHAGVYFCEVRTSVGMVSVKIVRE